MVAGTTDCVAEYEGILSIIDFKTSSKMREQDTIDSWMIQATFYALAWECLTGQKISQLVIIMATIVKNMMMLVKIHLPLLHLHFIMTLMCI